jgi:hypothetical protein
MSPSFHFIALDAEFAALFVRDTNFQQTDLLSEELLAKH